MHFNLVDIAYGISIRANSDGYVVSIKDQSNNVLETLKLSLDDKSDMTLIAQNFLTIKEQFPNYQTIGFISESEYYSLIPKDFFRQETAQALLQMQYPTIANNQEIFYYQLQQQDAVFIYACDHKLVSTLKNVFNDISFEHQLVMAIEKSIDSLSIYLKDNRLDCIVKLQGKIKLLNSFSYQIAEDIVYHILNILHQLQIDHTKTIIQIFAEDILKNAHQEVLHTYLPNIVFQSI